mmetsp:Transcript_43323/g.73675  ORF Transcript_43323/g.73675 Transcript_43323/m.73675 type:complete len:209 (-) Transcript_43323:66-692(-)
MFICSSSSSPPLPLELELCWLSSPSPSVDATLASSPVKQDKYEVRLDRTRSLRATSPLRKPFASSAAACRLLNLASAFCSWRISRCSCSCFNFSLAYSSCASLFTLGDPVDALASPMLPEPFEEFGKPNFRTCSTRTSSHSRSVIFASVDWGRIEGQHPALDRITGRSRQIMFPKSRPEGTSRAERLSITLTVGSVFFSRTCGPFSRP